MPLRIKARGHPGYWFHPIWSIPEDAEFELIVEGAPAEVYPYSKSLLLLSNQRHTVDVSWPLHELATAPLSNETFRMGMLG